MVIWGLIGCAPFGLATFATHSLPVLEISACGFGLLAGFLWRIFSRRFIRGGSTRLWAGGGYLNMIGGLGGGAAIMIVGIWGHSVGIDRLMLGGVVLSLGCAVLLFFVLRTRFDRERAVAFWT